MQFQMNPIAISKSGKIFPEAENKRKKKQFEGGACNLNDDVAADKQKRKRGSKWDTYAEAGGSGS